MRDRGVRWKQVKEAWGTSETENLVLNLVQMSRKEAGGGMNEPVVSTPSSMKLKSPQRKVSKVWSVLSIERTKSSWTLALP